MQQRIGETCERVCKDKAIAELSRDSTSATYIPLRVRDIVRETMSGPPAGRKEESYLARENVMLQSQVKHPSSLAVELLFLN